MGDGFRKEEGDMIMSTNYYLHEDICPTCGHSGETLHIGQSSGGWCFGLHVIPECGLNDLSAWRERWERGGTIRSEYGDEIEGSKMLAIIRREGWPDESRPLQDKWLNENDAVQGPRGFARRRVDGRYCIGHGQGTWDLISGIR